MRFTNREMTWGWARHVLAVAALGLFLTFLGPFQSQQSMTPAPRALFWVSLVATGYALALAVSRLLRDRPRGEVLRALSVAAISSLPQMFVVSWALVQVRPGRTITVANFPMLFLSVLSIQLVIVATQRWLSSRREEASIATSGDKPIEEMRGRLARSLRGDLLALEAEDHYVRLHHLSGSTLILHRFGDALNEIDPAAGLQVHRGWWVADNAVSGTFVRGGKRWLKLSNALEVPVSRTYLRPVLDRGWPSIAG